MEVPRASKVVVGICRKEKNEELVQEIKTKENNNPIFLSLKNLINSQSEKEMEIFIQVNLRIIT